MGKNDSTGIREKDGQKLSLNYTYWTDLSLAQEMALAIKTQLAKVGIDVTTTGQDQMTWWTVALLETMTLQHGTQRGLTRNHINSFRNLLVLILMPFLFRHLKISRTIRMQDNAVFLPLLIRKWFRTLLLLH